MLAHGELAPPPILQTLGIALASIEPGCAVFTFEPQEYHKRSRLAGGRETLATQERRSSPSLTPPPTFAHGRLSPAAARWDKTLGEYILDWDDVRAAADPRAAALEFARSAFRHAGLICGWDTNLAATADSRPAPIR